MLAIGQESAVRKSSPECPGLAGSCTPAGKCHIQLGIPSATRPIEDRGLRGPQSHWIFPRLVAEMIAAVREQVVGVKAGISLLCRSAFRAFHDVIPLRSYQMLVAACLE